MKRAWQAAAMFLVAFAPAAADVSFSLIPDRVILLGLQGRNANLLSLDAATGKVRWERNILDFGNALWLEQGLVADRRGFVALGVGANKLVVIDSRNGAMVSETRVETQQYQALLATDGDRIYASGYLTNHTICLDSHSGRIEWESKANGLLYVVQDRVVAVNYRAGSVSSLDRRTGAEGWSKTIRGMVLAAAAETIVVTDYTTQRTVALSVASGEELWAIPQPCSTGTIVGELAILCEQGGTVRAVELSGGKERWTASPAVREQRRLLPSGEVVLAAGIGSGHIAAYDARTGRELYTLQGGAANNRAPCVLATNGRTAVLVRPRESKVLAVDVRSGSVLWEVRTAHIPYGVILARSMAVVGADGQFLGIEVRTGRRVWATPGPRITMFYGFALR